MNKYISWKDVKNNSMSSLSADEKIEIDLLSEIISKVIEKRHTLGITQRELEKLSGVKQESICRIENMKNVPQLDTLIKIMEPLGLKLSVCEQ